MREKITSLIVLLLLFGLSLQAQSLLETKQKAALKGQNQDLAEALADDPSALLKGKHGSGLALNPDSAYISGTVSALCPGQSTTLSSGISGSSYLWSTGGTQPFVLISSPGLIWLLVTDANACVSDTAFYNLAVGVPTNASFTWVDNGGTVSFTDATSGNPTTFAWAFGDGDSAFTANPAHMFQTVGTYFVCLTAGGGACGPTTWCDTVTISFVNTLPGLAIQLTAFPNPVNQELNLEFKVPGEAALQFRLIDAAGKVVFSESWDSGEGKFSIPVADLRSGLYILRAEGREEAWFRRISVQH